MFLVQGNLSLIHCMGGAMDESISLALTHSVEYRIGLVIFGNIVYIHCSIQFILARIRKLSRVGIICYRLAIWFHPAYSLFTVHSNCRLKPLTGSCCVTITSDIVKGCGSSLTDVSMIQSFQSTTTAFTNIIASKRFTDGNSKFVREIFKFCPD